MVSRKDPKHSNPGFGFPWGAVRERFLILFLVGAAAVGGLASCKKPDERQTPAQQGQAASVGGSQAQGAQGSESKAKYGGTLRFFMESEPPDVDTHTAVSGSAEVWWFVGDRLMDFDWQTGNVVPSLAKSWEISPDGLVYTFHLEQGVRFHEKAPVNGRELTAQDVVANFQRLATPRPEFVYNSRFRVVETMEAVDKYTVRFTLKRQDAGFLANLAYHYFIMAAPEAWEQYGSLKNPERTAIGTGPFILEQWTPGVGARFRKNPNYWKKGLPYLDRVEWSINTDKAARVTAFRTGKVDFLTPVDLSDKEDVEKTNPGLQWIRANESPFNALRFNLQDRPFNDVRVRRAVDLAIDRDEIIKLVAQGEGEYGPPIPFWLPKWTVPAAELKQRPEYGGWPMDRRLAEARRLLAEAGYPNGLKVKSFAPTGSRLSVAIATVVKEQLKKVGVELDLDTVDWGVAQKRHVDGDFQTSIYSYASGVDPTEYLEVFYGCKGSRNYSKWCDQEFDDLVAKQAQELDEGKRREMVLKAQRIILDQHVLPMTLQYYRFEGGHPYVKGTTQMPVGRSGFFYHADRIWLDR